MMNRRHFFGTSLGLGIGNAVHPGTPGQLPVASETNTALVERRQQTIRARAYDVCELVNLARRPKVEQGKLLDRLEFELTLALFSFRCHEQPLFGNHVGLTLHPTGNEQRLDESLDRAKGVIEFELPFLLLLTGQTHAECREQVETIVERMIQGDELCDRYATKRPTTDEEQEAATLTARTFAAWVLAAVDATFGAQRAFNEAEQNHRA